MLKFCNYEGRGRVYCSPSYNRLNIPRPNQSGQEEAEIIATASVYWEDWRSSRSSSSRWRRMVGRECATALQSGPGRCKQPLGVNNSPSMFLCSKRMLHLGASDKDGLRPIWDAAATVAALVVSPDPSLNLYAVAFTADQTLTSIHTRNGVTELILCNYFLRDSPKFVSALALIQDQKLNGSRHVPDRRRERLSSRWSAGSFHRMTLRGMYGERRTRAPRSTRAPSFSALPLHFSFYK